MTAVFTVAAWRRTGWPSSIWLSFSSPSIFSPLSPQVRKRCFHTSSPCTIRIRPYFRSSLLASPLSTFGNYALVTPNTNLINAPVPAQSLNTIPTHIACPEYYRNSQWIPPLDTEIDLKSEDEVESMRKVGKIAKKILMLGGQITKEGVTTEYIDDELHKAILSHGAYPSPLNYRGFPKSICTSVNNVIAHGIPDSRPLKSGDIINIDITVFLDGFHADCSATFLVGNVDEPGKKLVEATKEAMEVGINVCKPGVEIRRIGEVISNYVRSKGYSVSKDFCGHGIGYNFHTLPLVQHSRNNDKTVMLPGMTFTIEPILCQGSSRHIQWMDGWTVVTVDGSRAAQFEETVCITETGVEILTKLE